MKTILAAIFGLSLQFCVAQTYVLDASFGTNGNLVNSDPTAAVKGLLVQGNYFLLSGNTITCINYAGEKVESFGMGGTLSIDIATEDEIFTPIDMVYHEGFIYVYGNARNFDAGLSDMIICKLASDGNFDASFGNNGMVRVDLNPTEKMMDLEFEADGGLFCIGSRKQTTEQTVYFKLHADGMIDYDFDASGYKTLMVGESNVGAAIVPYGTGYLLIGENYPTLSAGLQTLYITQIDASGTVDVNYGDNGFYYTTMSAGTAKRSIAKVVLHNDKLYINHLASTIQGYDNLLIYDLNTNQKIYDQSGGSRYDFDIVGDSVYSFNYTFDMVPAHFNPTRFNIKRSHLDGSIDTTFCNEGLFNYELPYNSIPHYGGSSIPGCIIPDDNGNFALAGRIYEYNSDSFAMIRITPNLLATTTNEKEIIGVYPNPFEREITLTLNAKANEMTVFDLLGRQIVSPDFQTQGNGTYRVDLSQVKQSGTYLLKVSGEEGTVVKKIIKK